MSNTEGKPDLKVAIPPSTEPPCECMMCAILKDLTKEENTSFPCLRRIPTRHLVKGGILSRKGQQSPIELPAGIPAEVLSKLRAELPADVPVELPAKLPVETLVELPAPVPVELPDNEVQPMPQEIDGIPISVVLLLRQIYKEEEKRASRGASSSKDAKEPDSASTTCSDSEDLPEPKIRPSIYQLIDEGKPQEWPHKNDDLLCNVGSVEQKPTILAPTKKLAEPKKAEICNARYNAFSPRYASATPGSPYPPTCGSYIPYRPCFALTAEDSAR
ncbi:hypothetical protein HDK77DRAFT_442065 [Phyllosticta capitalensis]|uniref:Uncharacterized protein n=1 Tax=Phyllosticta capitalensis TaxID=121624 RepID=A0ABR1Z4V2_9PEZI